MAMTGLTIWLCLTGWFLHTTHGFMPNLRKNQYPGSISHEVMTENAVRRMAIIFMDDYPDIFPDQDAALSTNDFKFALRKFEAGSSEPDTDDELMHLAPVHFNAEQIVEANQRILYERRRVVTAMNDDAMDLAQVLTGGLLHTLQDFYSHTNWVELGHTNINPALGDPDQVDNIGPVASLDQPTCLNCTSYTCTDNIHDDVIAGGLLTSGYAFLDPQGGPPQHPDLSEYKPLDKQKCSHGGEDDRTSAIPATGGINKDTTAPEYSPHSYHHTLAAELAEDASVEFLKALREVRNETEFSKYIGLVLGSSLCFIIDTTGSMAQEIEAVVALTINITRESASGSNPPSDYLLVPFNDPEFGPLFITTNPDLMVLALSNLTASGGGDSPELFFSGALLALDGVRPGSTCYAFTDAAAKDEHLLEEALALADANNVVVQMLLTAATLTVADSSNSQLPSTTSDRHAINRRRHRRQTVGWEYYDELALSSGGQVIYTTDSEISEAVKVVLVGLGTIQVTLLQRDYLMHVGEEHYDIPVDNTLSDVVISITGSITAMEIHDANGILQIPGVEGSGADVIVITEVSTVKLYSIVSPIRGIWRVSITSSSQYSLSVTAASLLGFSYQFVKDIPSAHSGYREIEGKPVAGGSEIIIVKLYGASAVSIAGGIHGDVTHLILASIDGRELARYQMFELQPMQEYEVTADLPTEGFRIVLEGTDSSGNALHRVNPSVVDTSSISLSTKSSYSVMPGSVIHVNITLTNNGSADVYTVVVSDTEGFYTTIDQSTVTIGPDAPVTVKATFQVPNDVSLGEVSTVTATATSATDGNFVVFKLATSSPTVDTVPPTCTIIATGHSGVCYEPASCETDSWYVQFTAQDVDMGLYGIKSEETHHSANISTESFTPGTTNQVTGVYRSDCCHGSVTIVASDTLGNAGRCHVTYTDDTITTTVTPTTTIGGSDDTRPPVCTLGSRGHTGACAILDTSTCAGDHWNLAFTVQDATGSGLAAVYTVDSPGNVTMDSYDEGTHDVINAVYMSDCCHEYFTLAIMDKAGNTGECYFQYDPLEGDNGAIAVITNVLTIFTGVFVYIIIVFSD